ncbi:MAG: class I SAM-dependent methyltransferase [Planctomycetes bacterium]|nr:class I SAM-dependent methyltransferase [Planctomycetota bacterium]
MIQTAERTDCLTSRLIANDDPYTESVRAGGGLLRRGHRWDFVAMRWWSRIYEYRWLTDAVEAFFGPDRRGRTALDAACGGGHPGCFMLADMGFAHVRAVDLFDTHPMMGSLKRRNLSYARADLTEPIEGRYDLVVSLSLLEHLELDAQRVVLGNLCDAVGPGGALLMTFVVPGFEHDTDVDAHLACCADHGLRVATEPLDAGRVMTSRTSPVPYPGWPALGRDETSVYRLFGVKA